MKRIRGTYLLLRTTVNDTLVETYEWLNYIKELLVPESGDLIVQGIWRGKGGHILNYKLLGEWKVWATVYRCNDTF